MEKVSGEDWIEEETWGARKEFEERMSHYVPETVRDSLGSSRMSLPSAASGQEAMSEKIDLGKWLLIEKHLKHYERRIKQVKEQLKSEDTHGKTSHCYKNRRFMKQNVANFSKRNDFTEHRIKQHLQFTFDGGPDDLLQDSLQCASSYQKLLHSSYNSSHG